ncbi:hypothetical protein CaldiYA01_16580 [Caldicellulosiruptor diazotrophicus]|uniref:Uncharacterized protein n=1 Tax=Caldicellulosiruptor diazotrophicus TaxID=2806205 RepID=A0ABN6E8A0_9FIRM|nr:hypothetical protein CaldiYA01_16580 [Caldicellulosiruptor diazotrophicus]
MQICVGKSKNIHVTGNEIAMVSKRKEFIREFSAFVLIFVSEMVGTIIIDKEFIITRGRVAAGKLIPLIIP